MLDSRPILTSISNYAAKRTVQTSYVYEDKHCYFRTYADPTRSKEGVSDMATPPALTIFASYKNENLALVKKLKTELENVLRPDQRHLLRIFVAPEIQGGDFYHRQIQAALKDHDCFILLYTDASVPTMDWSWCFYESGFYLSQHDAAPKLIVLHHPDVQPPPPLNLLQTVPATLDHIRQLLSDLFCTSLRDGTAPLIPREAPLASLDEAGKNIAELFQSAPVRSTYTPYLRLILTADDIQTLKNSNLTELGDTVQVEIEDHQLLKDLFDLLPPPPKTWGPLIRQLRGVAQGDPIFELSFAGWHRTLGRTILDAVERINFLPELPTFLAFNKNPYSSTLQILDQRIDASYVVHVIFSRLLPDNDPRPEGVLETLSNMLQVARYFRWGICEHYLQELKDPTISQEEKRRKTIPALLSAMARSINLTAQTKLLDNANAVAAMKEDEEKDTIRHLYREWDTMSISLFKALNERNIAETINWLEKLKEINKQYMELAAKRFYEEVQGLR
jgi:hypothetical protein